MKFPTIQLFLFIAAIALVLAYSVAKAAESFDTGGASGQKYWDEHFGDTGGASFGGSGGAVSLGGQEFTRVDAQAIIDSIKNGDFNSSAFAKALFVCIMDNPQSASKYLSTDPEKMDLTELYNYVKTKYPDLAGTSQQEQAIISAAQSVENQKKYGESYDKIISGITDNSASGQNSAVNSMPTPVSAVEIVDGKAIIGDAKPEPAAVGSQTKKIAVVGQAADDKKADSPKSESKNIFQQVFDYAGSVINSAVSATGLNTVGMVIGSAVNTVNLKISSIINPNTKTASKTTEFAGQKSNTKVLGSAKPATVAIGGSQSTPTQVPNTGYKPTQVPSTDYKPTQVLNTGYKPTQELNTDYKPTQELNTDYKPTYDPSTAVESEPTYKAPGYDEETKVTNLGGGQTPTYTPAKTGSFSAGFDNTQTSQSSNNQFDFFGSIESAYRSVTSWIQQIF